MDESHSEIRVRYVETDQMGIAHHSSYLAWLEIARTDFLRMRGMPYRTLEENGIRMPVLEVRLRYRAPARYDDSLTVAARLERSTPVRFSFAYTVSRTEDGKVLCEGSTEHAATDLNGRARRIPREICSVIGGSRAES